MPKNTIRCPECAALLTLGGPVEPGKRIRCPKCEAVFDVPDRKADSAAAAAYGVTGRPKRHQFKPKKHGSQTGALIAIVAVAGLLLAGAIVGGYFLLKDKKGDGGFAVRPPPASATTGIDIGQIAQEISGEDIDGVPFKLSDYRGKVVVLDFWGHW
jgi:uncharacterized C2H2 Zn-finger protein